MSYVISPNMQLQIPGVGTEPGPEYATDVNNSLTIIDSHNHSAGSGVQITPAGLNLNSDVSILGNNLILVNTVRFISLLMPIPNASPNIGCIYVAGNELYYNDYSGGHQVQLTNNGSVNAGAGSITGLPSGTASVSYTSSTYVFQSATNTAATIDVGSVILRNTTPSSYGLTLSPPNALGSNYNLVLPLNPSSQSVLTQDTSGNISNALPNSSITLTNSTISVANGGVTRAMQSAMNYTIAGPYNVNTTASITIGTFNVTGTGVRPIRIFFTSYGGISSFTASSSVQSFVVTITNTTTGNVCIGQYSNPFFDNGLGYLMLQLEFFDTSAIGIAQLYNYSISMGVFAGSGSISTVNLYVIGYEY